MNESDNELYRWGILGCGNIANTFARSMALSSNGKLFACAARDVSRAQSFAKQYDIAHVENDYVSLVRREDIDAVYIATTHNFHFEQIVLCLKHNKHVLCEKPLTLNAAQARLVSQIAKERNLLVVEAVWTRFLPAIQALQNRINENIIGTISSVYVNFSIQPDVSNTHRLMNKSLAGGALLDLGIYPLTFADLVYSQAPQSIEATAKMSETGVDESSHYLLGYAGGETALLSASFTRTAPIQAVIYGDKGHIVVPHFLGAQGFEVLINGEPTVQHDYKYDDTAPFIFEIEHFHDCLADSVVTSPIHPLEKSILLLDIMDDIRGKIGLKYEETLEKAVL